MKDHPIFRKNMGLYSMYYKWGSYTKNKIHDMETDFTTAGLHDIFPFNETVRDYKEELTANSIYTNPRRLAWIKEHANPRPNKENKVIQSTLKNLN